MKKDYADISKIPIKSKDWVTIFDDSNEAEHNLQIEELLLETDDIRQFSATVISSSDNDLKPMSVITLDIQKTTPVMGRVVTRSVKEISSKDPIYTTFNLEKKIVAEIKTYLDARLSNDFGAPFKLVVKYLVAANVLPGMSEKEAHAFVRKLMQKNKDLFRSSGGWIFSLKSTVDKTRLDTLGSSEVRIVDLAKLVLGIKYVLESGVLGPVKVVGKNND
jgi:hypothetical protein